MGGLRFTPCKVMFLDGLSVNIVRGVSLDGLFTLRGGSLDGLFHPFGVMSLVGLFTLFRVVSLVDCLHSLEWCH